MLVPLAALVGCVILLLGNNSAVVRKTVDLAPFNDPSVPIATLTQLRKDVLGSDPMAGGKLRLGLEFDQVALGDSRLNASVKGTGSLIGDDHRFEVRFEGYLESRPTPKGSRFYYGSADGTVTVKGAQLPASFVVTAIPGEDKYLLTITVQTPDDGIALLSYGEIYPEYMEILEQKFGKRGT